MAFIGIITSKSNEESLYKLLNENIEYCKVKYKIFIINEDSIRKYEKMIFDLIIINKESSIIKHKPEVIKKYLENSKCIVLNSDIYNKLEIINKLNLEIITYGLNLKSTVTASSIDENKMSICLQRSINNYKNDIIEPHETNINRHNIEKYNMIIAYILRVYYN